MRAPMQTILWIIGVYIVICVGAYFANRAFMYFPDPERYTPAQAGLAGVDEFEIATGDGETLVAWQSPARAGTETGLFVHGNAGNAAGRAYKIEIMRAGGLGVLFVNNRGYGGSSGRPSEKANVADAIVAYDYLAGLGVAASDIILYGESLGSGQAVKLAAQRPARAIILEAPLTSTVDVGKQTYWFLPLRYLMTDQYRNEDNIAAVTIPLLVLHGERDTVIPVDMGRRVHAAANEPKRLELIASAAHSDLFDHGAWGRAEAFLASLPSQ